MLQEVLAMGVTPEGIALGILIGIAIDRWLLRLVLLPILLAHDRR